MNILDKSIYYATKVFENKMRKVRKTPAILHSLEVATIAASMTDDMDCYCAAVLHDVIEDAGVTYGSLEQEFGTKIAKLVLSDTEDKSIRSWQIRKQTTIEFLNKNQEVNVFILILSDKLANLRSIYNDILFYNRPYWDNFNESDPVKQYWYYHSIALATKSLEKFPAYEEYQELIKRIFNK